MAVQLKVQKNLTVLNEEKDCNNEHMETVTINNLNAPKHGTVIPNRVFVGGIAPATTEVDLVHLFSSYGNVTGTKIISDRAGVSKGYGFVTFETEEEAKRLQKDADNIFLGQRRLNIAPAIKKQGFARGSYDCSPGSPMPQGQIMRANGVTFAFHNGMAFFPQTQGAHSTHVEPSPVYQSAAAYGAVAATSPGPAYPYYAPQSQIFYSAPQYQYHVPQYDGCYEGGQVMVTDGNYVLPQFFVTPQPPPEIAYYQPATIHPQEPSATPSVQQVIYASPRAYESTLVYSPEPKCAMENGMGNHNSSGMAVINKEEGEPLTTTNHSRRSRESTPVVSLLKLYKGKEEQGRRKHQHHQDEGRRQHHLNNNNPDTANRNLKHAEARRNTPPSVPFSTAHANPNPRHPPVQVPQFPYYSRQVLGPPAALTSYYPPPQPPTRPRSFYRPRYGGGRGNRGGGGSSKWLAKDEELGQPLTPPITPRSEAVGVSASTEDVVQSMQALAI